VPAYVIACCAALTQFFSEIADDRRDDFLGIPDVVSEAVTKFTPPLYLPRQCPDTSPTAILSPDRKCVIVAP
jgi:hypothetical protein